jgi:mRNA-degrading endonuclease RelE of RelBE toxin-antitoxin system
MSLKKNWDVRIDESIYKFLKTLSSKEAEHLVASISAIQEDPHHKGGDLRRMPLGDNEYVWRRRVGAFYVWYDIHENARMVHLTLVERVR